jgi:hypothetical protein
MTTNAQPTVKDVTCVDGRFELAPAWFGVRNVALTLCACLPACALPVFVCCLFCLPVCLPACVPVCLCVPVAYLRACVLCACVLACLLACFCAGACLPPCHLLLRRVYVNFVNPFGETLRVPGRVGQSLYEVSLMHDVGMDGHDSANNENVQRMTENYLEDIFGEGPSQAQDHVILHGKWYDKVPPPMPEERTVLDDHVYHKDLTPYSRLGSQIILTKVSE